VQLAPARDLPLHIGQPPIEAADRGTLRLDLAEEVADFVHPDVGEPPVAHQHGERRDDHGDAAQDHQRETTREAEPHGAAAIAPHEQQTETLPTIQAVEASARGIATRCGGSSIRPSGVSTL
jgi:hypothetical protein